MTGVGGTNIHNIDVRIGDKRLVAAECHRYAVVVGKPLGSAEVSRANAIEFRAINMFQIRGELSTHITGAEYAPSYRLIQSLSPHLLLS
jgi:hypothetical protein